MQAGGWFKLQYLNGSSWTQVGTDATTGADGKVEIPFSLAGLSQWSSRQYRLHERSDGSSPGVTSQTSSSFMPGPTELGSNVLRVDVEDGIFPSTKGPEYPAEATLSTDGEAFLKGAKVEEFGVRGFSTSEVPEEALQAQVRGQPERDRCVRHGIGQELDPARQLARPLVRP